MPALLFDLLHNISPTWVNTLVIVRLRHGVAGLGFGSVPGALSAGLLIGVIEVGVGLQ